MPQNYYATKLLNVFIVITRSFILVDRSLYKALPKFLQCVNWADLDQVTETHKLLKSWMPITMDVSGRGYPVGMVSCDV